MSTMQRKVRVIGVKAPPPPGSDEKPSETVQFIGISDSGELGELDIIGSSAEWSSHLIMEIGFSNPDLFGSFKVGDEFQVELTKVTS